jgi:HD domain
VTTYDSARAAVKDDSEFCAADGRLLAVMPLHAITSLHGEEGLRERLLIEIAPLPAADRTRIGSALKLMSLAHAQDRRQREPYENHPLRVTTRILSHYRVTDPDIACAALLHDVVEDHAEDISPDGTRQGALDMLGWQFGERTAQVVAAVTNPVWEPGRDKHEQYREHVAASLAASPWARVVKVSDFTDNAVGLFHTTGPKVPELARKYRPLVPVLRELILRPDTPLPPEVKDIIIRQLGKTEVRFASFG